MTPESDVIYLDYAATTPVDPAVMQAARAQVASLLSAEPDEIIFTSDATESNNLAVLGIARANADRGRHLVTSRIEHKAVLDPCKRLEKEGFSVTYLAPDRL